MRPQLLWTILVSVLMMFFGASGTVQLAAAQSASSEKSAKSLKTSKASKTATTKKPSRTAKSSAGSKTAQKSTGKGATAKRKATSKTTYKASGKKVAAQRNSKASFKKVSLRSAPPPETDIDVVLDANGQPLLQSSAFYVVNQKTGAVLLERKSNVSVPIASITKLMTAMVVLEAKQNLQEVLTISEADIDTLKGTGSRVVVGTQLSREDLLHLMLMSSENRAASALARHYPGGAESCVKAMNIKARLLGLWDTHFEDSSGLNPGNVSSPRDLGVMVTAAATYPLIREFSTSAERYIEIAGRTQHFINTNNLVRNPDWEISLSKTGYISEAGRCLVMQAWVQHQPVVMVLMDSTGRYTRTADAQRVRKWLETSAAGRLLLAKNGESSAHF